MAKTKVKNKVPKRGSAERDGTYMLKLVLYLIVGSQWLRVVDPDLTTQIPIPLGLLIGILFASHDHFQIDRKIEYAVLLIACLIGFWAHTGILLTIL